MKMKKKKREKSKVSRTGGVWENAKNSNYPVPTPREMPRENKTLKVLFKKVHVFYVGVFARLRLQQAFVRECNFPIFHNHVL